MTFGGARTGTRGYIAFSSYLDVPVVMGSRSTNIKCQIGGYKGRKLEDEDYIAFRAKEDIWLLFIKKSGSDEFDQEKITLRVVMDLRKDVYERGPRNIFKFRIYSNEFDRGMGCRLEGPLSHIRQLQTSYLTESPLICSVPSHGKPPSY